MSPVAPFSRTHSSKALFSPQIFYFKHIILSSVSSYTNMILRNTLINISGNMAFVAVNIKNIIFTCKNVILIDSFVVE